MRLIDKNTIIKMLNTMDRYTSEKLTLCGTNKTFPKNEVFIVDDVYEGLDELPSVEPTVNQWISVSDRLPEESGDYLVWALFACEEYPTYSIVHYDADFEAFGEWDDIFDPHTFGFLDSVFEEIKGVIAWMPIPEFEMYEIPQ